MSLFIYDAPANIYIDKFKDWFRVWNSFAAFRGNEGNFKKIGAIRPLQRIAPIQI
jgi:hypothetical protein